MNILVAKIGSDSAANGPAEGWGRRTAVLRRSGRGRTRPCALECRRRTARRCAWLLQSLIHWGSHLKLTKRLSLQCFRSSKAEVAIKIYEKYKLLDPQRRRQEADVTKDEENAEEGDVKMFEENAEEASACSKSHSSRCLRRRRRVRVEENFGRPHPA